MTKEQKADALLKAEGAQVTILDVIACAVGIACLLWGWS